MEPRLLTNGMFLTKDRISKLTNAGLSNVMISIDSPDEAINDAIRGEGAFAAACAGVENAKAIGWDIRINSVINKKTAATFKDLVLFAKKNGIKRVSCFYMSPIGRSEQHGELWLDPDAYIAFKSQLEKDIAEIQKLPGFENMDIIVEPAYLPWALGKTLDISNFGGCGGGCLNTFKKREYLLIMCNGDVYPCVMLLQHPGGLGNVKKLSLKKIIENDLAWSIVKRDKVGTSCDTCVNYSLCGMGCAGYSLLELNDSKLPDPRCIPGKHIPLCPIMKYNFKGNLYGGASDEVLKN